MKKFALLLVIGVALLVGCDQKGAKKDEKKKEGDKPAAAATDKAPAATDKAPAKEEPKK